MVSNRRVSEGGDAPVIKPPPMWCRNCGHPIHLKYCPNCGQHIGDHNTRLWNILMEFSEEFIRLDSKFFRTMIPLITKPGFLTKQWVEGKRVRYITPLKLYITISAIAFLVISIQVNRQAVHLNSLGVDFKADSSSDVQELMRNPEDMWLVAQAKHAALNATMVDKKLLLDHYLSHLPTASLLLVPIAALLFSCLYIRREKYYVEHLVFTLHFNAFCFLMIGLVNAVPGRLPGGVVFLWVVIYLLLALKRNYGQGWGKTILKFGIFSFSYVVLIALAMGITAIASAIMAGDSAPHAIPTIGEKAGTTKPLSQATSPPSHDQH